MVKRNIVATIQARMTSTRLPGKILKPAMGRPLLAYMIERLRRIPSVEDILLCTTVNPSDDVLVDFAQKQGIMCYRGSEENVMSRVLEAAQEYDVETIVETTSDCPFIDPEICEQVIQLYRDSRADYCSNIYKRSYPIGMDVQVFKTDILADAYLRTTDPEEREHVSLFIYRHPELYDLQWLEAPEELHDPHLRVTLDTAQDYEMLCKVLEEIYPHNQCFKLSDVLAYLQMHPEVRAMNNDVQHKWVNY